MDSPRLKAYPSSDISPWYYFLILFPNSYLLLSAAGSFLSPFTPSKNSKLWFSFECLSWRPKARKSILCSFPSLIPMQISAEPAEMPKRCKITASPPSPGAKPMWFRKAPECLHRQILKKYFPLKHNPPAHPPPLPARSPLTPYHSLPGNYLLRLPPAGRSQSSGSGSGWQEVTGRRELAVPPEARLGGGDPASVPSPSWETARGWGAGGRSEVCSCWASIQGHGPAFAVPTRAVCAGTAPGSPPCPCPRPLQVDKLGCPSPPPCSVRQNCIQQRNSVSLGWEGTWGCFCACQGQWMRHGDMALLWNVCLSRHEQFLVMWINLFGADEEFLGFSPFISLWVQLRGWSIRTAFAPKAQSVLGISLINAHKMQLAAVLLSRVGMPRDARAACYFGKAALPRKGALPGDGSVLTSPLPLPHSMLWAQGWVRMSVEPVPKGTGLWSSSASLPQQTEFHTAQGTLSGKEKSSWVIRNGIWASDRGSLSPKLCLQWEEQGAQRTSCASQVLLQLCHHSHQLGFAGLEPLSTPRAPGLVSNTITFQTPF